MALTDELALVTKLKALRVPCNPFDGLRTLEQRKESVRAALKAVADVTYAVRDGKNVTMAMQFQRCYGEAL